MSFLFMSDRVLYTCSCGLKRPIPKIYFCRHCLKVRCSDCVSHEVDSHYCPNCLEYMPSPEAKLKKNRCANCFDCPSCMHTLSTRATNVQVPSPEDPLKMIPKKVYYLVCGFCRWTSRDVNIPDQHVATGSWPELENTNTKRINLLLEHYRALAQREKLEKERRRFTGRGGYLHFSDKFGVSTMMARKLAGLSVASPREEDNRCQELEPAIADTVVPELDPSYINALLDLTSVATVKQRLMQPEFQPACSTELYPRHKNLLIKRSQRCKECEHNLSKPEYNPSSIKFKIQLTAFYHLVELRIKSIPTWKVNQTSNVELTLCNPTSHLTHVTFLPLEEVKGATAKVELPTCEFVMAPRDDTAEFDDMADLQTYKDNPTVVTFRKANKIGFLVKVTPEVEHEDVKIGLVMKHDFMNIVVSVQSEQRDPQITLLTHELWLNMGPCKK